MAPKFELNLKRIGNPNKRLEYITKNQKALINYCMIKKNWDLAWSLGILQMPTLRLKRCDKPSGQFLHIQIANRDGAGYKEFPLEENIDLNISTNEDSSIANSEARLDENLPRCDHRGILTNSEDGIVSVITSQSFNSGEFVIEWHGLNQDLTQTDFKIQNSGSLLYLGYVTTQCLNATTTKCVAKFIKHAEPDLANLRPTILLAPGTESRIQFVASRSIEEGEELFYNHNVPPKITYALIDHSN